MSRTTNSHAAQPDPRPRLAVVSAGLRQPSSTRLLADRLAAATGTAAAGGVGGGAGTSVEISVVELREHAHAITDALLTGFPGGGLAEVVETVVSADGLVVVTPVFSASYSGLLKSFTDILEPAALVDVPVLLGATGGTERHSLAIDFALRPLFAHLGADPVRTGVYAATSDWGADPAAGARLAARIERAGTELAGALVARHAARKPADAGAQLGSAPGDPPEDLNPGFVPFDRLLRR